MTHPAPASPTTHRPDATPLRLVLDIAGDEHGRWAADFRRELPDARVTLWPEADPDATIAAVWKPSQAFIDAHPRLESIFNLGAGVDALASLSLPAAARIYRLEDAGMGAQMNEYVCHALLRHVRQFDLYDEDARRDGHWQVREPRRPAQFPVGVMGLGVLGAPIARAIADQDLIELIDEGRIAGACLDVFRTEPLRADHPLRSRSAITITPHISAQTLHADSLAQVIANLRILQAGGEPTGLVHRERGY